MAAATAALVAEAAAANDDDVAVIVCLLFSGGRWCRRHRYAAQVCLTSTCMIGKYNNGRKKINKSRQEYRKFLILTMICNNMVFTRDQRHELLASR